MSFLLMLCLIQDPPVEQLKREIAHLEARLKEAQGEERRDLERKLEMMHRQLQEFQRQGNDEDLLNYMKQNEPELLKHAEFFKHAERHDVAEGILNGARDRMRLSHDNPEEYKRIHKVITGEQLSEVLGERIRMTQDDKERSAMKDQLQKLLNELFDAKEAMRRREVEEMSKQLEELKAQLKRRQEKRASIIDRRFKQLIGEGADDEW